MYLRFFNLREQPFNLTPDPRFLFLSPQHEEALSNLLYGIHERKGFIEITGEVGTGKTSLCRTLLDRLDDTVSTALIFNAYLNELELLQAIVSDFGIACQETTRKGYIDALNQYLLKEFTAGRNAMVLIDEAQNLEPRVLEQLRMLSNLETERGKLVQVVLVGQPELRDKLATPQMRQLDQRIAIRFHLRGLTRTETQQYIAHRLTVAGNGNAVTFTHAALARLHRHCVGIPRRINLLCDRILVSAYVEGTQRVTARLVRSSLRDLGGSWQRPAGWRRWGHPALTGGLIGGLATAGTVAALAGLWTPRPMPEQRRTVPAERVVAPQPAPAIPARPVQQPPPQVSRSQPAASSLASPEPLPAASPPPRQVSAETDVSPKHLELSRTLWQLKTQIEAARPGSPSNAQVDWAPLLSAAAEQAGLAIIPLEAILPQLTRLTRPCFIEIIPDASTSQPVLWVLTRGAVDRVLLYREPQGFTTLSFHELRRIWYGKLYLTLPQEASQAPLLGQGMQGARIQALQRALIDLGYLSGEPTGSFEAPTLQAVKNFQRDNLLAVDGYVGRRTLMMLLHFGGQSLEDTT